MATDPAPRSTSAPQAGGLPPLGPALYTARVENTDGTSGQVLIRDSSALEPGAADAAAPRSVGSTAPSGAGPDAGPRPAGSISLPTGGPVEDAEGFNPEQFLAMAWSTCLGETLRVVLAEQGLSAESAVSVEVGLHRDPAGGFCFAPRALMSIEGVGPARAQELAEAAHARCPVSKLLRGQGEPVVELMGHNRG